MEHSEGFKVATMGSKLFMSQQRGANTDQLSNIIQVIQLGRKTGVLTGRTWR